ncbi:class II glutamine amidotransferase [Veronia nyctiphanis]|uniref:Class II glutamine amidotransferase n=1 Tax=Veronia nyctiphanis TaxID=1278244 RepID=A0A4Q0YTZ8_9GAMM|nr:class II glutamine amidotransferase [Veronia nyctiphanis]RXJ74235.1 class II glutamine amidotransferase [Veronia nyctiphanis]
MCRWMSYIGKSVFLDELLYQPAHSLVSQSKDAVKAVTTVNADGFGLAWYGEKATPATYHEILPAWADKNLKSIAEHTRSACFLGHVRASTGATTSRENCHPFTWSKWSFMHNGQIPHFDTLRMGLERQLKEEWYLLRRGTTDSELLFLLLLQNGLDANPRQAMVETLSIVEQAMASKNIDEPFKACIALSNGNKIFGVRYSSDSKPPTLFYKTTPDAVVMASEPFDENRSGWRSVSPQSFLEISESDVKVTALSDLND